MDTFSRLVIGYHGCPQTFAGELLVGTRPIAAWQPSANDWDWLGHGIYFSEHAPERAFHWAQEQFAPRGVAPGVIGAVIQLGRCFDLLNEAVTTTLAATYRDLEQAYQRKGAPLAQYRGKDWKRRDLDCVVINTCIRRLHDAGKSYDTVRGAFLEGKPIYPGAGFSSESHIQLAVLDTSCILGVFRPNL